MMFEDTFQPCQLFDLGPVSPTINADPVSRPGPFFAPIPHQTGSVTEKAALLQAAWWWG